jgi:SAM-dependent methyltransferase
MSTHTLDSTHAIPRYLQPYASAAQRHGSGFGALLWASPATQEARFAAFTMLADFNGRSILDVGCGRADLLDFLLSRGIVPEHYVGLEAIEPLAAAADAKHLRNALIVRGDFVREPQRLFVAADIVLISGALNTLDTLDFYKTIRRCYEAATDALLFNFLDSPRLSGAAYLTWHHRNEVLAFCRSLSRDVREAGDYIDGDRTVALWKQ